MLSLAVAALRVGAETRVSERDCLARIRALAEDLGAFFSRSGLAIAVGGVAQLARVAAVRIIGAADKGAELAGFQIEASGAAGRALPDIAAIRAGMVGHCLTSPPSARGG